MFFYVINICNLQTKFSRFFLAVVYNVLSEEMPLINRTTEEKTMNKSRSEIRMRLNVVYK